MLMSILCFAVINCLHKLENTKKIASYPHHSTDLLIVYKHLSRDSRTCKASASASLPNPLKFNSVTYNKKVQYMSTGRQNLSLTTWRTIIGPGYNQDLSHKREIRHTCQKLKESSSLKHPCISFLFFVIPLIDLVSKQPNSQPKFTLMAPQNQEVMTFVAFKPSNSDLLGLPPLAEITVEVQTSQKDAQTLDRLDLLCN